MLTGVVLASVLSHVYCTCPDGWSQFKNSCYRDSGEGTGDWKYVRDVCKKEGGYLADITSQEENDFIEKLAFGEGYWFWIGVRYMNEGDEYVYDSSKKKITFAGWHEKEECTSIKRPNCVRMGYNGLWEHYECDSKQDFICESDTSINFKFLQSDGYSEGFRFNGHYYRVVGQLTATYDEAKNTCEENHAYLVEIDSYEENKFIYERITKRVFSGYIIDISKLPRLIGARDFEEEGKFKWIDGTPLTYENWWQGEPNNNDGEDCMEMRYWGKWNDVDCSYQNRYVCEISLDKNSSKESVENVKDEQLTTTESYSHPEFELTGGEDGYFIEESEEEEQLTTQFTTTEQLTPTESYQEENVHGVGGRSN